MRPPLTDDDIHTDPLDSKQVKEKKKRKAASTSDPKKERPRKRSTYKPKKAGAQEISQDLLNRLRDESEKEENFELVAA